MVRTMLRLKVTNSVTRYARNSETVCALRRCIPEETRRIVALHVALAMARRMHYGSDMKTHTTVMVESNSSRPNVAEHKSRTAAIRYARAVLKGCIVGEGYVQVYEGDRNEGGDPIEMLRA